MFQKRALVLFVVFAVVALLSPALLIPTFAQNKRPAVKLKKQPAKTIKARTNKPKTKPLSREQVVVQRWMRSLTLRDKVAQLVMITSYGENPRARSKDYREFAHNVRDLKVGGIIVVNRVAQGLVRNAEPKKMTAFLNRMQGLAKIPLIVGGDFERGASMRVSGTAKYPHQMAYGAAGDLGLTRALGSATAWEARALGVHWVFAPVADVNSNPDNPIINVRSFGENPERVAEHVAAFIEGAHSNKKNPILVTAKHFPGHGDTNVDSHMGMARLEADRSRLDALELVPFRAAILSGVDSIMTAHMSVPAVETEEDIPATISPKVLTGLLRRELAFSGLIVTDAMDMAGLAKQIPGREAAVRSLQAGADMLLMPTNPEAAINAVVEAVQSGRLTEERIDESLNRLLTAKAKLGLDRKRYVSTQKVESLLSVKELSTQAQTAADRAVTMVRNEGNILPLANSERACLLILPENRNGKQGKRLEEEAHVRAPLMRTTLLHPQMSDLEVDATVQEVASCEAVAVAAFVNVSAYRGDVALRGSYSRLMDLISTGKPPVILLSLGNPYLLRSFPKVSAFVATFSPVPTSEIAAVKALLGLIPINGRLPITIPDFAPIGTGLRVPAKSRP